MKKNKKKIYKAGGSKKFKPHMMYDPKTGKGYMANKIQDHLDMKEKGYDHRKRKVKKQSGGMYTDNTVSATGQGQVGNTANIVYQESDPRLQEERIKGQEETFRQLASEGQQTADQVKQMEEQSKIDIETAAAKEQAKGQMIDTSVRSGLELGKKAGMFEDAPTTTGALKTALTAFRAQRAANLAGKAQAGIKAGVQTFKQAQQGVKALELANKASGLPATIAAPQNVATLAEGAKGTGSALASGIGAAAANPMVLATVANLAGKGIRRLADDDDATTFTAGEATGDILSGAGEYAGYGAMIGSVVPGVGTAIGAGVGAVIGAGKAAITGLTGRNKARRAERRAKAERKRKIDKFNRQFASSVGGRMASVRAGQLGQKTYSGYD